MDHCNEPLSRAAAVAALFALALASSGALAGFAQAVPPSGWAAAASATERATYRAAANEAWNAGVMTTSAVVNVGGRSVAMPAAMRMAANAGRFAGGFAFSNPWVVGATIALPYVVDWFLNNGFRYDAASQQWQKAATGPGVCTVGPCYSYVPNFSTNNDTLDTRPWWPSIEQAASWMVGRTATATGWPGGGQVIVSAHRDGTSTQICYRTTGMNYEQCLVNTIRAERPVDSQTWNPATQADMENGMDGKTVPDSWPGPLPVNDPVLNPDASLNPQPYRVPNGAPQPVPDTNPQRYKQPVIDVIPMPSPWTVDLQPKDVESEDPAGQANPATPPASSPSGQTTTPKDGDLCSLHPEALACSSLDQPPDVDLSTRTPSISIAPDSGWGADTAACPAPRHVHPAGRDIPIPFDLFCTFFAGIRPIVIAMAWLGAAFILVGAVKQS